MKNYLSKALEKNNTVIIPGFGALTITSERTKDIYFIPYLKHNDGTLNNIISEINNSNKEISDNIIHEFVKEMEKSLEISKSYEINGFGRFKKLNSGDIEFEKWEDYNKEKIIKTKKSINNIDNLNNLNTKNKVNTSSKTENKEAEKQKEIEIVDFKENESKKNNLDNLIIQEEEKEIIKIIDTKNNKKNKITNEEIIIDTKENIESNKSENQNLDSTNKSFEKIEINNQITSNEIEEKETTINQEKHDNSELENTNKLKSKRKRKLIK